MKRSALYIFLIASLLTLTGCMKEQELVADDIQVNTILVKEDGAVQSAIVGDFDKPYYSKEEFENFIDEEIVSYNEIAGKDVVIVKSFEVKEGIAKVIIDYASIKEYVSFNQVEAEYLTAEEALDDENIPESFINAKDGDAVSKEDVLGHKDYKIVVFSEPLDVRVEGEVKFYSNAVLLNDKAVQSAQEGISVVVFKP